MATMMSDAKQSPPVIDLTEETAATYSVTSDLQRPVKQRRISSRIQRQNARASETADAGANADNKTSRRVLDVRAGRSDGQSCDTDTQNKDSSSPVESRQPNRDTGVAYRKNDYYEVERILDRRTKNYGGDSAAGGRNVVEYLVKWKNPPEYTGEGSYWEDTWQIAENLDPHSLAVAFRLFPKDGDPVNDVTIEQIESEDYEVDLNIEGDLFDEDDDIAEEEEKEAVIMLEDVKDDDYDITEEIDVQKYNDVAHLGKSDYDKPGTVELELNRMTFRVGQCFISLDGNSFYTISTILPSQRKAKW